MKTTAQTTTQAPEQYTIPAKLLSKGSTNAKTTKNVRETYILYLIPTDKNSKGKNLCPKASIGCANACLESAGRGKFKNVRNARSNKTEYFVQDPKTFTAQLILEIEFLRIKAKRQNKEIAIRLNGTADVDFLFLFQKYHNWNYTEKAETPGSGNAGIYFYDYTPNIQKFKRYRGTKYALIFSKKEDNPEEVQTAIDLCGKVSAVFKGDIPETYKGIKVIDGDQRDDLILDIIQDPEPIIIALKAKGKAKHDKTGFTITDY